MGEKRHTQLYTKESLELYATGNKSLEEIDIDSS